MLQARAVLVEQGLVELAAGAVRMERQALFWRIASRSTR